eukprot:6915461-Karenia_brevis.AAC.1
MKMPKSWSKCNHPAGCEALAVIGEVQKLLTKHFVHKNGGNARCPTLVRVAIELLRSLPLVAMVTDKDS